MISPEKMINQDLLPDKMWLINESDGDPGSATTSNSSTVKSTSSLLKLETKKEKDIVSELKQYHSPLIREYADLKMSKERKRARKAKICFILAIFIILTLCVITLVAALQIFLNIDEDIKDTVTSEKNLDRNSTEMVTTNLTSTSVNKIP